jgi:hypothetical protein
LVDEVVQRSTDRADSSGTTLLDDGGFRAEIARAVLEKAVEAEMTGHLGDEKYDPEGCGEGAWGAGLGGCVLKGRPTGIRLIVRKERPRSGPI